MINQFEYIKKKILEKYGFDLSLYNQSYVERRLKARMLACHVDDYISYWDILEKNPQEYNLLLNAFNINVTEFFRDISLWEYLEKDFFLKLKEEKIKEKKTLRIWSCGCATGEEPYSISILLKEIFSKELENSEIMVSIFATDNDQDAIEKAKRGIYRENSLKNLFSFKPQILKKYFFESIDKNNTVWIVNNEIKKIVKFMFHDVLKDPPPIKYIDIIFCRNVMIYFTQESKDLALKNFYSSLSKDGFLIIGKSESILSKEYFEPFNLLERVYKKI